MFYAAAQNGPSELGKALNTRAFLHTFLVECRDHAAEPDFMKRLTKKMKKFDARTTAGPKNAESEAINTKKTASPKRPTQAEATIEPVAAVKTTNPERPTQPTAVVSEPPRVNISFE
jgi:hypothetical protein